MGEEGESKNKYVMVAHIIYGIGVVSDLKSLVESNAIRFEIDYHWESILLPIF